MELAVQTINYQRLFARYSYTREDNADGIVPDTQPDIARIIDVSVMLFIRDKEILQDSVSLHCSGKADVLYTTDENNALYHMEIPISFNQRVETKGALPEDNIITCTGVQSCDAHMINTRKVSVRFNAVFDICLYKDVSETVTVGLKENNGWCEQTKKLEISNTKSLTVKNFTLAEDLTLDNNEPNIKFITDSDLSIESVETKVSANRLLVSAEAVYSCICISTDDIPFTFSKTFDINQSCDISNVSENDKYRVSFELRSLEVIPASDISGSERYLSLSAGVIMTVETAEKMEISALDDVYCLKSEYTYEKKELSFRKYSEYSVIDVKAEASDGNTECSEIFYAKYFPDRDIGIQSDSGVFVINGTIMYVYKNTNGEFFQKRIKVSTKTENSVHFSSVQIKQQNISWQIRENEVFFDYTLKVSAIDETTVNLGCISSVEEGNSYEPDRYDGLSAIIRRTASNVSLWDLAKEFRTTKEAISEANGIEGDTVIPADSLLLIPVN